MKRCFILVLCVCIFLVGCGLNRGFLALTNRINMEKLQLGMTKDEVRQALGAPGRIEAYSGTEFWLYYTEWLPDGYTTYEEFTPIAFKDGCVDGWGRKYYEKITEKTGDEIDLETESSE